LTAAHFSLIFFGFSFFLGALLLAPSLTSLLISSVR
jgi:hypothetical protein